VSWARNGRRRIEDNHFVWRVIDLSSFVFDNHLMVAVSVDEIKRDLLAYLQRVEAGEMLVIMHAGKPLAELKPVRSDSLGLRPFGLGAGDFIVPDDFDEPLTEIMIDDFEGR